MVTLKRQRLHCRDGCIAAETDTTVLLTQGTTLCCASHSLRQAETTSFCVRIIRVGGSYYRNALCRHQRSTFGARKQLARDGVIAVMYGTRWTRLCRSPWEREMDLRASRQHILSIGPALTPDQHRQTNRLTLSLMTPHF